jgi:surfactin synthase thioesterase subunit
MVISSVNPPHCIMDDVDMHSSMDTDTLVEKSAKMGGMPQVFKEEPELLESFIAGLRGDLKALESYVPPKPADVERTDVEVAVLYSDRDYIVHPSKLKEWEHYLHCSEYISFPGDHFYLFEPSNRRAVGRIISEASR